MKKKNKGFTLIELLAVIVILAIIAIIAVPQVLKIIERSKKGAFTRSAEGLLKSSKIYYYNSQLDIAPQDTNFSCTSSSNRCISTNRLDSNNKPFELEMSGVVGDGTIDIFADGTVEFNISNGSYCAKKNRSSENIIIEKGLCTADVTPPTITLGTVTTNSNHVVIGYDIRDNSGNSAIDWTTIDIKYGDNDIADDYSGDFANINNISAGGFTIVNLVNNKTYRYKVCISDKYGNRGCSDVATFTAEYTSAPTIAISSLPNDDNYPVTVNSKEYAVGQTVTIKYDGIDAATVTRYFKSSKVGKSDVQLVACGTGRIPDATCSGGTVNANENFVIDTWYKFDGTVNVTYSETNVASGNPDSIIAYVSDSDGGLGTPVEVDLANIDTVKPTITVLTDSIDSKSNYVEIPFTVEDSHSGVNETTVECLTTSTLPADARLSVSKDPNEQNKYKCVFTNLIAGQSYNYSITAKDMVENSDSTESATVTTEDIIFPQVSRQGYNLSGNPLSSSENLTAEYVSKDY